MIQLVREKRALCCITCSHQILSQRAATTKQNREELFFIVKVRIFVALTSAKQGI